MTYSVIDVTTSGSVGVITLQRPAKLNAINRVMAVELLRALAELAAMRAVVVTGGVTIFSSGADLLEVTEMGIRGEVLEALDALAGLPVPTIAAVEGYCLGAGLELALCCDLRVGGHGAKFGSPEVLRGSTPGGGATQRLPRLVGPARAKEFLFSGEQIDTATAERWGLINRVVPDGQAAPTALAMAAKLAVGAPLALSAMKRLVNEAQALSLADGLALERKVSAALQASEDVREGARALRERRQPNFRGN